MHIAEVVTIAKSLPLLRLNTYKSLILSYSADYRRIFVKNPDILLYMCDTANEQQAQRDRLFLRWFNAYEQKKKYVIKTAVVYDEGIPNYVSLIVPIEHPLLEDIQATFESEIIMFQNNK